MFFSGEKVLTALMRPMVPMEIRSSMLMPVDFKLFGDVDHQPQVVLDQQLPCRLLHRFLAGEQVGKDLFLLLAVERRGQRLRAVDVVDTLLPAQPGSKFLQALPQPACLPPRPVFSFVFARPSS